VDIGVLIILELIFVQVGVLLGLGNVSVCFDLLRLIFTGKLP